MSSNSSRNNHIAVFFKGSIISLIGVLILGIINFLIRRTLALTLSSEDFGFLYSAISLCMIFLSYLDLGLNQSATILLSKSLSESNKKKSNSIYTIFLSTKFLCAFAVFLILAFTYKFWLNDFFKYKKFAPYFAIITILISNAIVSAPYAILTALKKFILLYASYIFSPLLILVTIFTIRINNEILVPAIIFPLSAFVVFIALSFLIAKFGFVPRYKYIKNSEALKSIFHLSKWVAISTAGLSTMYYLDSLMITYFRTLQEVALYNVALPVMQVAQSLMVIPNVFIPIVSEMWQKGEIRKIADICTIITEFFFYLLWPIIFTIILLSKHLIVFLFSSKFTDASTALIILFIGNIFFSLASFYMGTLNAGTNAKNVTYSIITGNIVNIILNITLIPVFGITGAATATTLSYFSILIFLFFKMQSTLKYQLKFFNKKTILIITIGLSGIILALLFSNHTLKIMLGIAFFLNIIYFIITYKKLKEYFNSISKIIFKNNNQSIIL